MKAQNLHIQTEISRNDAKLHEYRGYQHFLESLVKLKGDYKESDMEGNSLLVLFIEQISQKPNEFVQKIDRRDLE